MDYDPIDLASLAAGWASGLEHGPSVSLSIDDAEFLVDVAEMLHRRWLDIPGGDFPVVWAYEVSEPLGRELGQLAVNDLEVAEEIARSLIAEGMGRGQQTPHPEAAP